LVTAEIDKHCGDQLQRMDAIAERVQTRGETL
jgi:hypothetical protein